MNTAPAVAAARPRPPGSPAAGERIRVTGIVQGVGLRPVVWRLAAECGVVGRVWNDAGGVVIDAWGSRAALDRLAGRLRAEAPPLARIDAVLRRPLDDSERAPQDFRIAGSREGEVDTGVPADAAACEQCLREVGDPSNRRARYAFTNCTHCGPRLSIVTAVPYDRVRTSMAAFPMCGQCRTEYGDPGDRRFHAQPNACPACGPRLWLEDADGNERLPEAGTDVIQTAARLIARGEIIAVKGIGGFHLACDAVNTDAVAALRRRKTRYHKPFALMARDVEMVGRYAKMSPEEAELLRHHAAPVVVLAAAGEPLARGVAPGQSTLGFMLPYTPLHHLLMQDLSRPIVLTSGNRSDEPQAVDNRDARDRLAGIADHTLMHDRDIVNRLDDSVVRFADGVPRLLRRARGYAPQPIPLPEGYARAPHVLAMGGELKNTFCLLQRGQAVLSQHIGDLEDAATARDFRASLDLYRRLFQHRPAAVAVDCHPDYLSGVHGRALAAELDVPLVEVQHHHAHVAACLAEHGVAIDAGPVLGVVLDGLGLGGDGTLWGGEFLLADYAGFRRLARFRPVPLPGGAQAMREPWRNTWAHLRTAFGWPEFLARYPGLQLTGFLDARPLRTLGAMWDRGVNCPPASSCGRLFDAVAAAAGVCASETSYEGQAAVELEALAGPWFDAEAGSGYGFELRDGEVKTLEWRVLWEALLEDLGAGIGAGRIAARFHQGLAAAVSRVAATLCAEHEIGTVALGGGVFQNALLLEGVGARLRAAGLEVLSPAAVPANDGGLSLGQAAVAAARLMNEKTASGGV